MTVHLVLREYDRIYRGDDDVQPVSHEEGQLIVAPRYFDRLRIFDESHRSSTKDEHIFDWRYNWARARHWVGVMHVGDLVVEILPKIDQPDAESHKSSFERTNFIYMLSLVENIPFRPRSVAGQSLGRAPVLEMLIQFFINALSQELIRGRHHDYLTRQDNQRLLRGKLIFNQHIRHNIARRDRFFVEYDEFLPDTLLNQIFKATCRRLMDIARSSSAREQVKRCLMMLSDISDRHLRLEDFDRVQSDRQNERFGQALQFCRMIFLGYAPTAQFGKNTTFSLLFSMHDLFERFVAKFIRRFVLGEGELNDINISTQGLDHGKYLLERAEPGQKNTENQRGEVALKPDILLTRGAAPGGEVQRLVIDTKWKRPNPEGTFRQGVSNSDFYQLFAYAHRYKSHHNILLYPWVFGAKPRDWSIPDLAREQKIHMRFVPLHHDFSSVGGKEELIKSLRGMIKNMLPAEV